ncbi:hypothetical protein [Ornithinimicrobium kibberense]|uniref:hypothetical protein n=1 Tax=Ornithinimicrobium kibberense TaxID=282060 RepID=UPI00360DFB85
MPQPLLLVWVDFCQAGVESPDQLHEEQPGRGEQIGEGLGRVAEDAGILGFKDVDHPLDDGLWCEH